jgi:hypothetical protein
MKRRNVLLGIAAAGCVTAASANALAGVLQSPDPTLVGRLRRVLENRAMHTEAQWALACEVLRGHPAKLAGCTDAQLAKTLRANILADHQAGRTLDLESWQISVTEARLLELIRSCDRIGRGLT